MFIWKGKRQVKKHNLLTASILMALVASGHYSFVEAANQDAVFNLGEHVVRGQVANENVVNQPLGTLGNQVQNVGILGKQDALETPFTAMTISNAALQNFGSPDRGQTDMISLSPSVRDTASSLYNDMSIRGFQILGHSMFLNNVPGMLDQQRSADVYVDTATVIAGPSLGIAGTQTQYDSAAGTINYTSKKAGNTPEVAVGVHYNGGRNIKEVVDLGKRFGDNNRYGIRVMADYIHGKTRIEREKIKSHDIFVNLDQKTSHNKTNLLVGYNYVNQNASPDTFDVVEGLATLPKAPKAGISYKPEYAYNRYDNWITTFNHEQKFNQHMTGFINAGYHRLDWKGFIDGTPTINNLNGDYTIGLTNWPLGITKKYMAVGVKGDFKTGNVRHNYVVNLDRNIFNYFETQTLGWGDNGNVTVRGNVYRNIVDGSDYYHHSRTEGGAPWTQTQTVTGWHITDTVEFNDRLSALIGVHGHRLVDSKADGAKPTYKGVLPTYALNYKVTPDFSVYASHSASFLAGEMVSGDKYANKGEILEPTKAKQNEFGLKYKNGDVLHTLSFYKIEQANYNDYTVGDKTYYRPYGTKVNKGVEYSIVGALTKKLDVIGGASYIHSKQALSNKAVNGVAKWSGTLGLVYKATDAVSLITRLNYLGKATILNEQYTVPSHVNVDFGVNYKTNWNGSPVTVRAMLHNVFGKDYWIPKAGGNSLILGQPRTFTLGFTAHL